MSEKKNKFESLRPNRAETLLQMAEDMIRLRGYDGFSFRDLATEANIKSASVHYHFPSKEDLGVAIARRYSARTLTALGDPHATTESPNEKMDRFIAVFRNVTREDGRVCLFLIFGSEIATLPKTLQDEVQMYFENTTAWLSELLRQFGPSKATDDLRRRARAIIAALDGAMIAARVTKDVRVFDTIAGELKSSGLIPTAVRIDRRQPRKK